MHGYLSWVVFIFQDILMNKKLKNFLQHIFVNDLSWNIFRPFIYIAKRLAASRVNYKKNPYIILLTKNAEAIFKDKTVRHGPFSGMLFEGVMPGGSSYYAKLLGSYEKIMGNV